MTSFSVSPFYNPAASLGGVWYGQPHANQRGNVRSKRMYLLEQDDRKQEIICSVILTLCLLFAFATCVGQFALS